MALTPYLDQLHVLDGQGPDTFNCVHCGEPHTHQELLMWFRRSEDAETCTASIIDLAGGAYEIKEVSNQYNPSDRRDGIVIGLSCEQCGQWSAVSFAQHKGLTYIDCLPFPKSLLTYTFSKESVR